MKLKYMLIPHIYYLILVSVFYLITIELQAQDFECLDCHENLVEHSVHNDALGCQDCHSDVEDESHMEGSVAKVNCATCHSEYAETVSKDIHHRLKIGSKAPTCKTCHGTHEIKSPGVIKNISSEFCGKCHSNITLSTRYHSTSNAASCFECHNETDHKPELELSVHKNLECSDCHNFIANNLASHPDNIPHSKVADCYLCHGDVAQEYKESIHGISLSEGIDEAAKCWDCHGSHAIEPVKDATSKVYPSNLPATCGTCHDNPEFVNKFSMSSKHPGSSYSKSVHGKIVESGDFSAANCVTCHGAHDIKNRVMPESKISSFNVPNTCIQCHKEVTEEYEQSIHWIMAKKGVREAPVCNDCHSEHNITAISTVDKKAGIRKLQEETCSQCHQNPVIARRYGLAGNEAKNYQDSYHGLAVLRGDEDAAMCIDCHGVHKILPKDHPESTVNSANVTNTCQKCHTNASDVFSQSYSHTAQHASVSKIENIVRDLYIWLIIVVIGGMILHNLIIFIYEIKKRRKKVKNAITIPRFTPNEVVQHILLLTSFILLAITGFALKFPESWWAEGLKAIGMSETVRQYIHRVSAVVMMVLGLYHIFYLFFTRRGRDVLLNLIPKLEDAKQVVDNILYYLKIKKNRPEFDSYDYAEKAEYWALIWGTLVMGITGLILWFPTIVGDWAPIWLIKVSEIVHFYEAILATLAILVWHWFFVIFHPAEYPMSFVWIDGKMSLDHYRHHHEKHFKKVVLQWYKANNNLMDGKKMSYSVGLFLDTFKKNNLNPDEIIQTELNKDTKLRNWLEQEIGKAE